MKPTALDRRKMEAIVKESDEGKQLFDYMGRKLVRLRGHGGTGKTIMLLQSAYKAFERRGERTLVLTYNHALAADIRRLIALLRVPSNPEEGGIKVSTVMSYMNYWFSRLGIIGSGDEVSYDDYENNLATAIELISGGAIEQQDIERIVRNEPDLFEFHNVIVDEAQDWPQGEVELLKHLFRPSNIALADGIDQVIRKSTPNWGDGTDASLQVTIPLVKGLRMKRNLSLFIKEVAEKAGFNWDIKPNDNAGGGRIIIIVGTYSNNLNLHEDLLAQAKKSGNSELDFLFCVPFQDVFMKAGKKHSVLGQALVNVGYEVWNGVDVSTRTDFPRSVWQYRIVQYASCRGLEGWTVVLEKADLQWKNFVESRRAEGLTGEQELVFEGLDEISNRDAWRKMLIAFTRPIDTLVITLENKNSLFSEWLLDLVKECGPYAQVLETQDESR